MLIHKVKHIQYFSERVFLQYFLMSSVINAYFSFL